MREILFRAKRIDDGEWVEGFLFSTNEHTYIAYPNQFDDDLFLSPKEIFIEVDPKTVCQYTGLTDKNGRKIFEGDIVRYTDEVIGKEKVEEVEYNETHAAFCRIHKSEMGLQYLFTDESIANRCEVIGNIYDNPAFVGVT